MLGLWHCLAISPLPVSAVQPSTTLIAVESFQISGGNGNSALEFNECASLNVNLRNNGATVLTGVIGKLSTSTSGVSVWRGDSAYPDIPIGGSIANLTPFHIQTGPDLGCGTVIDLSLTVTSAGLPDFIIPFQIVSGSAGPAVSVDSGDVPKAIPNLASADSAVDVSGITGAISKVTVALRIKHSFDSDLSISLISPEGMKIDLSSGRGGFRANYGSSCVAPIVFDDSAAISIRAGVNPLAGVFRPEQALAAFNGKSGGAVNGTWKLRVQDNARTDITTLQCWTLTLTSSVCSDGGGICDQPPTVNVTNPANNSEFVASAGAPASPLLNGLMAYWKNDEVTGARVDTIGSNHLINVNGLVEPVGGQIGNAAHFSGASGSFLHAPSDSSLSFSNESFTVSAWLKLRSKAEGSGSAVSKSEYEYALRYDDVSDRFTFSVNGLTGRVSADGLGSPALNVWYYVVAWYDSTNHTKNIQVNNGPLNSTIHTTGNPITTNDFYLGSIEGFNDLWNGDIDEVKIWRRVLTGSERASDYNNGVAATPLTSSRAITGVYVSPDGRANGNGSISDPTDLLTALKKTATRAQPGSTIWLRGGTYLYRSRIYSDISGLPNQPITIRSYPGEWAVIDGWLTVTGGNVVMRNFELMNSSASRGNDDVQDGFVIHAADSKFVNLVVHDCIGDGIEFWSGAVNSELNGCLMYRNGYYDPVEARPRGHNLYTQNSIGTKLVKDNISFDAYDHGIHPYTAQNSITGFRFFGNISFNNGVSQYQSIGRPNFFIGALQPVKDVIFDGNYSYHTLGVAHSGNDFGWSGALNTNITIINNYFVGGNTPAQLDYFTGPIIFTNNILAGVYSAAILSPVPGVPFSTYTWDSNHYYSRRDAGQFDFTIEGLIHKTFSDWKLTTGFDAHSTYVNSLPTGAKIVVLPNDYEPGRANIVVYNWDLKPTVAVDVSAAIAVGTRYEVRNVRDFSGAPVASGTYTGGSIILPTTGTASGPLFNTFVLLPLSQIASSLARVANSADDSRLTVPAVALSALASDVDGTVSQVDFFDGDVLIGTATASPYDLTWKDVPLGLHEIVAVATDDAGSKTISSPVQIRVSPNASQTGFITGINLGTSRKTASGWLGMRISVGPDPLTITDLGRYFLSGNQGRHILKLVRAMDGSDVPDGAVTVSMSGGRVGEFKYSALPNPVTLQPNTSYYIVSEEAIGGDPWPLSNGSITTTSVANCDGPVYNQFLSDSVSGWIFTPLKGRALGLVDFKYLIGEILPMRSVSLIQPSGSGVFNQPANIALEADAWYKNAAVTKVEFFAGENLLGLTAAKPYRLSWDNVPAGNYIITARATGSDGITALSRPVTITVNPAGNLSPIASIISPTNNSAFIAPANITLASNAKDSDGNVAKVEFFDESGLIGTASASPFSLLWNNVSAGTYTITARATDNVGAVTYSSPVQIAVNPPANILPTLTITSPLDNTVFGAPGNLTLSADAADSDGTITKVQFLQGSTLLGTVTQSPYTFVWSNFTAGDYIIAAKAVDNGGAVTVSSPVKVTVKPASLSVESFSISGGNGNGVIDPNECAALGVSLRNNGTSSLTGVAATLSASAAGVHIWQAKTSYPDIPAGAVMANTVPFNILTAPDFVCGSIIDFTLTVITSGGTTFVLPLKVATGSPSAAVSFSATDVPQAIPDPGAVDSAVLVAGVTGALAKVTVGLHIRHPFDADLQISLIAPDGTAVNLSAANGGHQDDMGASCSALTLFDDDAPKAISESNAPFIGAFRADQPLSVFNGKSGAAVNGTWTLRLTDGAAADAGSIECWVLNLTASTCSDGGGPCNNAPTLSVAGPLKAATFKAPLSASTSPLLNGLVAYWKNDEATGARLDSIGSNHLLNINSLVGSSAGKIGNAAHFTGGGGSFLYAPNDSSLSFNNESFTVSAWMKLNSKASGPCSSVSKSRYEYALRYDDVPDRFTFVVNGLNSSVAANGLGSPSLNAWYYVVAWYDSTNLTKNIQVNNGTVSSTPHSTGIQMTTNDFYLGSIEGFNDLWNGDIDEVKIWRRVLTATERASDYNTGLGGTPLTSSGAVTDVFVSPNGSVDGDGSISDPTDLLTALEKTTTRAQPGTTIWLRGGTYLYRSRIYSNISGLANQPITVRSYPGEWAVIDGWINVSGSYVVMRNFELMNSSTLRGNANVQDGFVIVAANSKFINLVVHDCIGDGVELWSAALNAELNGCLIYRNGWYDPVQARSRGHNIYTQNTTGIKLIKDNISFLAYDHGIHPYTASNSITGYLITRNIAFNNGITPQTSIGAPNLFCGGLQPVMNVTFDQNYSYHVLGVAHSGNDFGWSGSLNTNINIINNYFVGGSSPLQVDFFTGPVVCTNNTVIGYDKAVDFTPVPGIPYSKHTWNRNTYFNREDNGNINCVVEGLVPKTFPQWKSTTGWDANSTYTSSLPTGTKVVVLPNDYEPGRANIVVYNWNLSSTVAVDISSAMTVGTRYEVRNALNFFGSPVAAGTYAGGSITLPMGGTANGLLFNTFVLLPVWVNASPTVAITSPSNGSTLTGPVNISVNTTPSDSDGTIRKVEFFNGAILIGSTTTAPFNLVWNNVGQGNYTLTALATDDDGAVGSSAPVNITVVPQPDLLPAVGMTSPANGATFSAGANIILSANASDADGTVAKVDFYRGTTLLVSITNAPYSFTWVNVPAGAYTLTAKAVDNVLGVTTSAPINITVNGGSQAGFVTSTAPGVIRNDFNGWLGMKFTVGSSPITVISLGRYYHSGNSAPHTVKIVQASNGADVPNGSVSVTMGGVPAGQFKYAALATSVILSANTSYYLVSQEAPGGDVWANESTTVTTKPVAACNGAMYNSTGSWTFRVGANTTFGPVDFIYATANQAPTVSITSPANGATFPAPANLTINSTASDSDGTISKVELFNGSTLLGTDTTSPYSFSWNNVAAGNYALTAKATDNSGAVTTSSAISITVNPPANQPPTVSITSPANGATFTAPANITITSTAADSDGTISKVEFFNGSTLLGTDTTTPYSISWNNVAAGSYTLTAKATDSSGAVTTSGAISITVNPTANQSPTVSITSPADGATFAAPANITINSSASDSDGTISKVELFNGSTLLGTDTTAPYSISWNNVAAGSYTLTAKATDNSGAVTTSSPIDVTVNASGTQAAFVTGATVGALRNDFSGWLGMKFTVGATPLSITALGRYVISGNSATHTVKLVNASNGADVPNGSVSIALTGATGGQFKYIGLISPITLSANTAYYIVSQETPGGDQWADESTTVTTSGVASCNGSILNAGSWTFRLPANTTFVPVNFMYTPPNQAPVMSVTSPASGATFTAPANITVNTTATDSDGTISKVELFNGTTLLGTDTASPYNFTWNNVVAGSYTLTAKATDNAGAVTTSSAISITVNPPANQTPVVSITSPANGATFTAPADITVNSTATDSDGTISKVELFNGTTLLGTDTGSPFTFSWNNVVAGSYTLTAKATDNAGAVTTSSAISITVNPPANQSPTVSITSPVSGATFTAPANITFDATATDSDGTISKVELFNGSTLLGTQLGSPYNFSWNNVAAGSYTLTAKATDNAGAVTTSSPINITVNAGGSQTAFISGATLGALRNDFNGWLGMKFTVGASPLSVTALGRYVISGNSGTHTVKLVNATDGGDVPNGSVSIALSGATAGQFKYVGLGSPITLSANTSYYVVSQESPGGDRWADESTTVTTSGAGSCDGAILNSAGWLFRLPANTTFVPVNFMYGTPNQAPTISITSPASGATFTGPANITISSTASDSDGTISKVELFNGSTLLGTDTAPPYNFSWNNVAAGSYTLTAKATDNSGAVTTSNPINITVNPAANQAPGAFVTGATLGALRNDFSGWLGMKFTVGASPLNVTALGRYVISGNNGTHTMKLVNASNGSDVPNGSVSVVLSGATAGQFKYGALASSVTLLANTSYYLVSQESPGGDDWAVETTTVTTSGVASCDGAILNSGSWLYRPPANTSFVPVNFTYGPPNQAPVVSITSPASGATFNAPANISVNATASDNDGTVARVDFFADTTLLGTAATSPYSVPWNNIGAGSYTLTAKATDNSGAVTTSSPIDITVNPSTSFITGTSLGALRNDYSGWLGMQFTVGDSPITATALGRFVFSGNTGTHTLKLVDGTSGIDVPNSSLSISLNGATPGQFTYVNLPAPITLSANTPYYLVSQESPGGDQWAVETTTVTTTLEATCDGAILGKPGNWTIRPGLNTLFVPVDFKY